LLRGKSKNVGGELLVVSSIAEMMSVSIPPIKNEVRNIAVDLMMF
jgi:hypothetical protein